MTNHEAVFEQGLNKGCEAPRRSNVDHSTQQQRKRRGLNVIVSLRRDEIECAGRKGGEKGVVGILLPSLLVPTLRVRERNGRGKRQR